MSAPVEHELGVDQHRARTVLIELRQPLAASEGATFSWTIEVDPPWDSLTEPSAISFADREAAHAWFTRGAALTAPEQAS